jgi:hypothetical protein
MLAHAFLVVATAAQRCADTAGLLRGYSKHDTKRLRRLVERIESTLKRPVTSADTRVQSRRLDRRLSTDTIAELVAATD